MDNLPNPTSLNQDIKTQKEEINTLKREGRQTHRRRKDKQKEEVKTNQEIKTQKEEIITLRREKRIEEVKTNTEEEKTNA